LRLRSARWSTSGAPGERTGSYSCVFPLPSHAGRATTAPPEKGGSPRRRPTPVIGQTGHHTLREARAACRTTQPDQTTQAAPASRRGPAEESGRSLRQIRRQNGGAIAPVLSFTQI